MGLPEKIRNMFGGGSASPFDQIKRTDREGDYWLSNELTPNVGYKSRRAYQNLCQAARSVAESYGYEAKDFRVFTNLGENSEGRPKIVYRMSRKFLLSLAHKLDIRKEEVRLLHTYLDIRVRQAEMSDEAKAAARVGRATREGKQFGHPKTRVPVRCQSMGYNREIISHLLDEIGGDLFAAVYDAIHVGVTGKHTPQLRAEMGIKSGTPFAGYDSQCLIIVSSVAVTLLSLFEAGELNKDNVIEETKRVVLEHKRAQLQASRHDAIGKKRSETGQVIFGAIRKSIASS